MLISLQLLNAAAPESFTEALSGIFEHSPWIPQRASQSVPFESFDALYDTLCTVVDDAEEAEQLKLIRAHPDLSGKLAVAGKLTEHSTEEQQSARLDQLSPERFEEINAMNDAYKARFAFPFIICVKDHTQDSIFENFRERLRNDISTELTAALTQIKRIGWHRLTGTVVQS
ncbi:MAG: 2-oxo-4-hydroxy-4-carboxy-5-ureidoimidazoline decarboxylase [Opitutales bacterium]|nr:2-oxo-4-hydroxy-4-carboxy-5-ureidoimidazoline decarboxylase [Opitutales bacterium]NRA27964.1 2-oxo-4-hydroxy-4-carboxy-5-ureidoimidazoline decarboxylase [Opitutales bacterium]